MGYRVGNLVWCIVGMLQFPALGTGCENSGAPEATCRAQPIEDKLRGKACQQQKGFTHVSI